MGRAGVAGRRFLLVGLILAGSAWAWQDALHLTLEEKEHFLRTAKIIRLKRLSEGITGSMRATLTDGKLTHDAHVQTIDEYKPVFTSMLGTEINFKDTYKGNIAAYRLAKLLGIAHMVPPSVYRKVQGNSAAVTWWVDNVLMTEKQRYFKKITPPDPDKWNKQIYIVRVFDQLIYNTDRNLGNLLITTDWRIKMIDHTRAFRLYRKVKNPKDLVKCDRKLLEALKRLDEATLRRELEPYLNKLEIRALLARRDFIVEFFEEKIAKEGEEAVLYDYLSTLDAEGRAVEADAETSRAGAASQ